MKNYFYPAFKLTLLSLIVLSGIYTMILLGIGKLMPAKGQGEQVSFRQHTYFVNIGQRFSRDEYFWSRPSAVNYNAAGSGASNKGPTNPDYLHTVRARIDSFLVHNPGIKRSEIPVDLVTASGSGLDPNISLAAAEVQVKRIARVRNLPETRLRSLIQQYVERPFLGLFGPEKLNVLKLNIALDALK
ncbi:MAG TPA: K(+)-transporting ATPase subunit C [Arachidicoccus sp.]|nr:K(+)-transporting ATPase subunit C [Arachidicoccus sp.]